MSVLKSKRTTSPIEFLNTARQLEIYSIQKAVNFPKRYTFYVSQPLANTATNIHKQLKMGNSIFPQSQHEARIRRDHFIKALSELQALVSQVEVAAQLFPIGEKQMQMWMELINKEDRLIRALLKKDKDRYKDLP